MSNIDQRTTPEALPPRAPRRSVADLFGLWWRGFAMGSADVVPGVSGGTMAFILGIYEELIDSIRGLTTPAFLSPLSKGKLAEAWGAGNLSFLVAVGVGILSAILTFARALEYALHNYPVYLWSFFFGLVIASAVVVSRRVKNWNPTLILAALVGTVAAFWLVGLVPAETPNTWWFLILSGAFAICAMILPGISGAFILLILGKYEYVLSAVKNFEIGTVALVAIGAFAGLLSFARVLSWLFHRYHDLTVALLIGLMVGPLRKIWPWKEVVREIFDAQGELLEQITRNVVPALNSELGIALALMIIGFVVVLLLERLAPPELEVGS